jgi:hypothetical protein
MSLLRSLTLLTALLAIGAPSAVHAQTTRPAISLSAGAFQYDLAGTGTTPMIAARVELPLSRFFLIEGGFTAARPAQEIFTPSSSVGREEVKTTFLAPEIQLQLQVPIAGGRVAPYLGLGGGSAIDLIDDAYGSSDNTVTASGALGLRYWLSDTFGIRGELRVRGIGTGFEGAAAEYTLGTSWRL